MRRIALVTSTRAEYGIMSRLISILSDDPEVEFQLYVTGMHLSSKFGDTYKEINVPILEKIDIEIEGPAYKSLSLAVSKFYESFKKHRPELLIVLGDRYEIFGVTQAAMFLNIPIAHIHGGETTEGAIDEAIRHSITKLSHLHFTSCEAYKNRVIQLGEDPSRVFNVGSLGVENIKTLKLLSKDELERSIDFKFNKRNILLTFHPVTLEGDSKTQFQAVLDALDELKDTSVIITCPNSDEGNDDILNLINDYAQTRSNVKVYKSLGLLRYLSAMKYSDVVLGNSSSGIIEAPALSVPTVNVGNRQKGRLQANSIFNCNAEKNEIVKAINNAFNFDKSTAVCPYDQPNTARRIVDVVKTYDLENILKKKFYDL